MLLHMFPQNKRIHITKIIDFFSVLLFIVKNENKKED